MEDSVLSLCLLAAVVVLLVLELFVPSGGAILLLAVACLAGSIYYASEAWYGSSPLVFWAYIVSVVVIVPTTVVATLRIMPNTSIGRRVMPEGPKSEEVTPYAKETAHLVSLIGRHGKATTMLGPGGLVTVEGERHHAESEGSLLIEAGEDVEVVSVKGMGLIVRAGRGERKTEDGSSSPWVDDTVEDRDSSEGGDSLDFDFTDV